MTRPYYEDDGIELYHGDCREILPTITPGFVDLVLTDPPYGIDYHSGRRAKPHAKIANDAELGWLDEVFTGVYQAMAKDSLCISFYGWPHADTFLQAWRRSGFTTKSHLTWVKNNFGLGQFTRGQHEPAYLLAKGSPSKPPLALSDVQYADITGNVHHPTQKPVSLCETWVACFTVKGQVVMDPFSGSGTTLIAAKNLGRKAIGIEFEERYCETAAQRLSQGVLALD